MPEEPTYQAAVIGLGFVGAGDQVSGDALGQFVRNLDGTHAAGMAYHDRVDLVAGASRDPGGCERFTERMGVANTYADWREMLAQESLDIVGVATNSPFHAEVTIACAEAGVRCVFCEKPIATKLSDADRMIDACSRADTLLVINHNRRWHPAYQAMKQEIAQGAIGNLVHVSAAWSSGRLGNVGTHVFDAILHVTGLEAEAVSGTIDRTGTPDCRGPQFRDPGGWGVVLLHNGVKLSVNATEGIALPWEIRIVGSDGQIVAHSKHAMLEPRDGEPRVLQGESEMPDSVCIAVDEIVRSLDGRAAPSSTGEDGIAAIEIILGFHRSDRLAGRWVDLPARGADRDIEVLVG